MLAFMAKIHSTFSGEYALEFHLDRAHWDPILHSAIPDRVRVNQEERTAPYTSEKKLLVEQVEKPGNMKYGRYLELLDTRIG